MSIAEEAQYEWMRNFLVAVAAVLLAQTAWADEAANAFPTAPGPAKWEAVATEVHAHPLFRNIDLEIESRPAFLLGDSPLAMRPPRSEDEPCTLFVGTDPDSAWTRIASLLRDANDLGDFMRLAVAHELGHCLRAVRRDALRALLQPVNAAGRHEGHWHNAVSREEAYADAYALAYFQDTHAARYPRAFALLRQVRIDPAFESPYYRLDALYRHLARDGFRRKGPLSGRVDHAIAASGIAAR